MRLHFRTLAAGACAILGLAALDARADVLTLKSNKVMKGLVEDEDATSVRFSQAGATIKVPKANIKSLEKESKAQGLTHIGESLRQQGKLEEAATYFGRALDADKAFKPAQDGLAAIQEAQDAKQKAMRQDTIGSIDQLMAQVRETIRKGEFAKTEKLLKEASDKTPTPEQKPVLRQLVTELYIAWAKDYLDKFDKTGAEGKLNIALAADPENDEVVAMLLKLWEGQPGKREEIIKIYETVLAKKPDDMTLRRKIGDLYYDMNKLDDAVLNYLEIYKSSETYKKSPLRDRIVETLERLHTEYAVKKDYDQALYYYDLLASIDPLTDPSARVHYEYLKTANALKQDDLQGRIELAQWCKANGLQQEMLDTLNYILKRDPENQVARAEIDAYAMGLMGQAQAALQQDDYYTAKALADLVAKSFPQSKEAVIKAQEIAQSANNEIARDEREKRVKALDYVKRGDTYYEQAMAAYDRMINSQYQTSTIRGAGSPKSQAINYFSSAIQAYEAALLIDPSLKDDPGQFVAPRLDESRQYLARLTQGPTYRKGSGKIIGPNPIRNQSSTTR